ncbi:MAG: hypothetical protein GXP43_03615 [bacterium]|nr:hypothetical protein [bacterium]
MLASIIVTGGDVKERKAKVDRLVAAIFEPFEVSKADVTYWTMAEFKGENVMDEIRGQIGKLGLSAHGASGVKVWVIYQAGLLSIPAQNALLKTLEEPLTGRFIILETERLESLLGTVKSRAEVVYVGGTGGGVTKGWRWLRQHLKLPYPSLIDLAYKLAAAEKEKIKEFLRECDEQLLEDEGVPGKVKVGLHDVLVFGLRALEGNVNSKHVLINVLWQAKRLTTEVESGK